MGVMGYLAGINTLYDCWEVKIREQRVAPLKTAEEHRNRCSSAVFLFHDTRYTKRDAIMVIILLPCRS